MELPESYFPTLARGALQLAIIGGLLFALHRVTRRFVSADRVARIFRFVLLGAVSTFLDVPQETWLEVIEARVPPKYIDLNRQCFLRGRQVVEACQQ